MTKSGLSRSVQEAIIQIVDDAYAAQSRPCETPDIYARLYPGHIYDVRHSSLRVTLSWMVRRGLLRRQRHGRYASFYPVNSRTREDDHD